MSGWAIGDGVERNMRWTVSDLEKELSGLVR